MVKTIVRSYNLGYVLLWNITIQYVYKCRLWELTLIPFVNPNIKRVQNTTQFQQELLLEVALLAKNCRHWIESAVFSKNGYFTGFVATV